VFAVLSLFWVATALMTLGPGWEQGVGLVREAGITGASAPIAAGVGAIADFAVGMGIAFRRTARPALYGALALSIIYLVSATFLVPRLWIDPMGPLVKLAPILALHVLALATLEDR
jgi:hypothetical protein